MRRLIAAALLVLAARARAQPAPASGAPDDHAAAINPAVMQAETDALRDAVSDGSTSVDALHARAGALFTNVQSQTPLVRPRWVPPEHENVDGRIGTVDGMIAAAQQRLEIYRKTHREPPPPDLVAAMGTARALRDAHRADFDRTGALAENQMGVFRYVKGQAGGLVELNRSMALITARIGEAFAYATFAHEAGHALAHEQGRLDAAHDIDDEVQAFRVQYLWLTVMDPTGMRLAVLDTTLRTYLKLHHDSPVTAQAVRYLDHLNDLWFTGGEEGKLREFVKNLGYSDDPPHDGVRPAPSAPRA